MKIKSAKFIKGIIGTDDILYDGRFQVAFMGRSNVGKSTLINSLAVTQNLARSSSSPGKTIRMDFFLINNKFYFVDLPGYGYARVSGELHEKLRKMMLWYLMYAGVKDRLVVLIIDAKVGVTDYDKEMLQILIEHRINHIVVANKSDNLKMGQKEKQLNQIQIDCGDSEVVSYSSKLKYGREKLLQKIFPYIDKLNLKR